MSIQIIVNQLKTISTNVNKVKTVKVKKITSIKITQEKNY